MDVIELASEAQALYIRPPVTQALEYFAPESTFLRDPLYSATARMAKLVDAWDLKSPVRKDVPVRFRLRAPNKSRACMRFFVQALCFLHRKNSDRSATLFLPLPWRPANVPKIQDTQPQTNNVTEKVTTAVADAFLFDSGQIPVMLLTVGYLGTANWPQKPCKAVQDVLAFV